MRRASKLLWYSRWLTTRGIPTEALTQRFVLIRLHVFVQVKYRGLDKPVHGNNSTFVESRQDLRLMAYLLGNNGASVSREVRPMHLYDVNVSLRLEKIHLYSGKYGRSSGIQTEKQASG